MKKRRFRIGFFTAIGSHTYQSDLLAGVVDSAIKNDVDIIRFANEYDYSFYKLDNQFDIMTSVAEKYNLDGILCLGWVTSAQKLGSVFAKNKEIPIISLGVQDENYVNVYQPGEIYIKEITDHLVNYHKYKNIVFICPIDTDTRVDTFISEMKRYGLYNKDYIICKEDVNLIEWDIQDRVMKIEDIIFNQRNLAVDAIISLYADEAKLLHERLVKRKIRVPEDIALVSWEESNSVRNNMPPITAVYFPFYEIGYTGCNILVDLLNGKEVEHNNIAKSKIFYRRSCGCTYSAFKKIKDDIVEVKESLLLIDDDTRNGIISLLTQESSVLEGKDLYNQFEQSLRLNSSDYFCLWFEEYCKDKYFTIEQLDLLQEDILTLRKHILPHVINDKKLSIVSNNIWTKIQIVINSWIERTLNMHERGCCTKKLV